LLGGLLEDHLPQVTVMDSETTRFWTTLLGAMVLTLGGMVVVML